jgi:predicted metal-binding membrane protein
LNHRYLPLEDEYTIRAIPLTGDEAWPFPISFAGSLLPKGAPLLNFSPRTRYCAADCHRMAAMLISGRSADENILPAAAIGAAKGVYFGCPLI